MSNLGIRTDASGTFGALTLGGVDKVTVGNNGIRAGSYAPNSITSAELTAGALIENSPVGIGYGPGAGGTVTQATSKSTAVTLNKPCGQITMNASALAANASVSFTLNNSLVTLTDIVVASTVTLTNYRVEARINAAGQVGIRVTNVSTSSLSEALKINFAIIKGATS